MQISEPTLSVSSSFSTQGLKYVLVGLICLVIDFGVTWLLLPSVHLLVANSIGFLVANAANFLLAHRWVFQSKVPSSQSVSTYMAVLLVSLVGLALSNLVVWVSISLWNAHFLIGKFLAASIGLIWNFGARKVWIYREIKE